MKLNVGVGYTEEWAEKAWPLFEEAGFRIVKSQSDPASDGEFLWCDVDYRGREPFPLQHLVDLVARARGIVEASYVPGLEVRLTADHDAD